QTPTFYSMDMEYDTEARSYFFDADNYEMTSPLGEMSFNFRTPYKATGSFAYIFGNKGLITVDYEYTDYSAMEYKSRNSEMNEVSYFNDLNETISNTFRATHNLRFGAELKLSPMFALRGGYAMFENPYQEDFLNSEGEHYNITGGLGFRVDNMSIDVSYLYNQETYIHSLYQTDENFLEAEYQQPADMTSTDHQLAVTLGWRF
ncbi:MAG: hydrocarbon degradation protein, partial [Marinilabiliaceae bacterium]